MHAEGLGPRGIDQVLAMARLIVLPSRPTTPSASQRNDFAARYLAYTNLCQRFANALTDVHAWLGATVGCYLFGVGLFHPLLHAGLSRRTSAV
jgi:hypothetical protein